MLPRLQTLLRNRSTPCAAYPLRIHEIELGMNGRTASTVGLLLTLLLTVPACGTKGDPSIFEPGQVWQYETREFESESRLTVCKVEQHETLGEIVHIHLDRLAIASKNAPDGVLRTVSHAPFLAESLRESLVALETTRSDLPDFERGYHMWAKSNLYGEAFVYAIPVAASLDGLQEYLEY